MDRHVEVVGLEGVRHLPEGAEGVAPGRLLEAKRLLRLAALLPGRGEAFPSECASLTHVQKASYVTSVGKCHSFKQKKVWVNAQQNKVLIQGLGSRLSMFKVIQGADNAFFNREI